MTASTCAILVLLSSLAAVSMSLVVVVPLSPSSSGGAALRQPSSVTSTTGGIRRWRGTAGSSRPKSSLFVANDSAEDGNDADRMKRKAAELREQIRKMEEQLGETRRERRRDDGVGGDAKEAAADAPGDGKMTLNKKRVLVVGANGRLGSMVTRYLLRNHPNTEVVAAVHYVGEDSPTARGYARLSYEVGAEDGVGSIGAAWSAEDRTATFEWDESMRGYNLQNLRLVECELLDPNQCRSVVEGCDAVVWCATDFNGNRPRAVSGLNVAFLFRAVTQPDKGRVEIEGLQNMLGALKTEKQEKKRKNSIMGLSSPSNNNDPINFVLVSTAPEAYADFETPFGTFIGLKRQGEQMLKEDFPSLTSTVLQFSRFEDNFCEEGLDVLREDAATGAENADDAGTIKERRQINRRDAAKAVVDSLLDEDLVGKTVQVWTQTR